MKELELLRKALYEANESEPLRSSFKVVTDDSELTYVGTLTYDKSIKLELSAQMNHTIDNFETSKEFETLSQQQLDDASKKLQKALSEILVKYVHEINAKLGSYGFKSVNKI